MKPREFWVIDETAGEGWAYLNPCAIPHSKEIHVIEYRAFQAQAKRIKALREALEYAQHRLAGMPHTELPINVRELDGTISQVRKMSADGEAYYEIMRALAKDDLARESTLRGENEN